jgi:hypothetical protein
VTYAGPWRAHDALGAHDAEDALGKGRRQALPEFGLADLPAADGRIEGERLVEDELRSRVSRAWRMATRLARTLPFQCLAAKSLLSTSSEFRTAMVR